MAWVRLDDKFARHPKIAKAGPLALALHVAALCYCNEQLTDGFVPKQIASTLLDFSGLAMRCWEGDLVGGGQTAEWTLVVDDLVESGLWESVPGGWQIHDYLDFQPSRAETLATKEARKEAGKRGGQAKSKQTASTVLSKTSSKTEAKVCPVPVPVPLKKESLSADADRAPDDDPEFERLWQAWAWHKTPKGSKKAATDEWNRHVRRPGVDPGAVLAAASAYCAQCRRTDTSTQHVERWLKKHRWEDDHGIVASLPTAEPWTYGLDPETVQRRRQILATCGTDEARERGLLDRWSAEAAARRTPHPAQESA